MAWAMERYRLTYSGGFHPWSDIHLCADLARKFREDKTLVTHVTFSGSQPMAFLDMGRYMGVPVFCISLFSLHWSPSLMRSFHLS